MVRERWSRGPDTSQWLELVGDLMEVGLGAGYIDQTRFWDIIAQVSPIIEAIRSILIFIDYHGSFARTGYPRSFFRGPCAPHTRKLAVAMYRGMLVHKLQIEDSSDARNGYLRVASENRLMY